MTSGPSNRSPQVRLLLAQAVHRLADAEVDSPENDARLLLAHVLGVPPPQLSLVNEIDDRQRRAFEGLVGQRAERVPLQHLTGRAYFRYLELEVGPGVFVPRPETEVMTGWAIERLEKLIADGRSPLVVELCAGSGAIAKSIATEVPGVLVHAVELSEEAAHYASANLWGSAVTLHVEDMTHALTELNGLVDLVIANPPYVPLDAYLSIPVEARDHDPTVALFSGDDGMDAIRVLVQVAARLLRPGGVLAFEHADVQGNSAPAVVAASKAFATIRDHTDYNARPRFTTAVRGSS